MEPSVTVFVTPYTMFPLKGRSAPLAFAVNPLEVSLKFEGGLQKAHSNLRETLKCRQWKQGITSRSLSLYLIISFSCDKCAAGVMQQQADTSALCSLTRSPAECTAWPVGSR